MFTQRVMCRLVTPVITGLSVFVSIIFYNRLSNQCIAFSGSATSCFPLWNSLIFLYHVCRISSSSQRIRGWAAISLSLFRAALLPHLSIWDKCIPRAFHWFISIFCVICTYPVCVSLSKHNKNNPGATLGQQAQMLSWTNAELPLPPPKWFSGMTKLKLQNSRMTLQQ